MCISTGSVLLKILMWPASIYLVCLFIATAVEKKLIVVQRCDSLDERGKEKQPCHCLRLWSCSLFNVTDVMSIMLTNLSISIVSAVG